jgi:rhodanese-related sulfurtransferase
MRTQFIALLFILIPALSIAQEWKTVPAKDFQGYINSGRGQLLDVRSAREFDGGHIDGAMNIDYTGDNFRQNILKLDKTKPVYIYCYSGGRSSEAAKILTDNGYQVVELAEGIKAWRDAQLPVTK